MFVTCDDLISLLPNRPVNSSIRVKEVGILALENNNKQGVWYILDKQELLRRVLRVWSRSKMLTVHMPKDMESKCGVTFKYSGTYWIVINYVARDGGSM